VAQPAGPEAGDVGPGLAPVGKPIGRRVVLGLVGLGPLISKDGTGLSALLPIGRFRIYTVTGSLPSRSRSEYTLRVRGLVDTPLELTYADLTAMAPTELTRDFQCVTGWRVSDVLWKGVRLGDVLDRAGVRPEGTALQFTSFDGVYTESLTMEQARRRDVIVAYELEGDELSDAHGGPVRLYVAPMYGYKSIKWLDEIIVTDEVREGYWEVRGYDTDAWVGASNGRDDDAT
jgi:DMSO/TMAO reductase YedYZ molybdopterin-dependent catalytic subunit